MFKMRWSLAEPRRCGSPVALLFAVMIAAVPASGTGGEERAAPGKVISRLDVFPDAVNLETASDRQSLVVVVTCADDTTREVTDSCRFELADVSLAQVQGRTVLPLADGQTTLSVHFDGRSSVVPVVVRDVATTRPISFRLDVMPVFMRAGCNSGSCHGSARGQDGFRLSLFGFDPEGDHFRLTRQMSVRRLNLALPEHSLMIEKALGRVPHSGGERFNESSQNYNTFMHWLDAGAPNDNPDVAKPTGIEILPPQAVLEGSGATQQVIVRARYSDGTDRDVTSLCLFLTSNETSAGVSADGLVTAGKRGEVFIMARFATFTEGIPIIVIPADLQYTRPDLPAHNAIDTLVYEKLHKLRISSSDLCSDEVFVRRATLDITGMLPTRAEAEVFCADGDAKKREKLVDELLSRKAFAEMWVMRWAELLQIRASDRVSYKATVGYYNWLRDQIANNAPFDRVVRELLSASGGTFTNPATNYYQVEGATLKVAENVAQVFMGMRIQCAQCHNHPFDRWTMDDYYGFAAFFTQVGRKSAEDPRETIIFNKGSGEMQHPVGGRNMAPKFLGGPQPDVAGRDRRAVVARWMTSPDNPYFARNLANIVWAHFFGVGIIDPVDDVRISNPASNPQLLDELARRFTAYQYDFKRLVRDICTSRTYQLATTTNPTNALDERNFSHGRVRRVRAEVLLDAISQVTETKNKFQGLPLGARAVQIADGNVGNYFLTTFGRATRKTVCSCEVKMTPNLSQALHLLNGEATSRRIREGGVVKRLLEGGASPRQVVEDLYLRCLSRKPTEREIAALEERLGAPPDAAQQQLEDVFWALLNSKEFLFNH